MATQNRQINVRTSRPHEDKYMKEWLSEPATLRWYPMTDEREIADAVRLCMGYIPLDACVTAEWCGIPCGMANLYLSSFKKLAHQCLFSIIVAAQFRNRGVGSALIRTLEERAADKFGIELLHLEVYEGNPAYRLYEKMGFVEYGKQSNFVRDEGTQDRTFLSKVLMQKKL
jgi:putative acetyltransferase